MADDDEEIRPNQVQENPDYVPDYDAGVPAHRVANGEVPLDLLQRQRGNIPNDAYQLTEQEAQREIANCILFCFMDFLSVGACVVAWLKDQGTCDKPLM